MGATNQERLQSIVQANSRDKKLLDEFLHFHLSVVQKLWSVDRIGEQIAEMQPPVIWEQIVQDYTSRVQKSADIKRFGLEANLHLDCFLMNAMAVLDTLAHEMRVLYSFQAVQQRPSNRPSRVYIGTIREDMLKHHTGKHITKYLAGELAKPWFETFASYRHCTTHESLIGSNVHLDVSAITGDLHQAVVPLPDDPRKRPFSYKQGRELKSYCKKTREDLAQMVSHCYYHVVKDIKQTNSVLPIP